MRYLTLGSCLKNEEPYIMDFIKYHRHVGVEHFVFFDREFAKLSELLKNEKDVEIVHFPDVAGNVHAEAWAKLIGMNQGKTKWLALIDADQALVPVQKTDVKEVLRPYESFASLQCNWHSFGSGGALTKEPGSVYERFTKRAKPSEGVNHHTQFICQPDRALAVRTHDPHHPRLPPGESSVNTKLQVISGPFAIPPVHDVLWVAHYINKSREEWLVKNAKGRADIFGEKMPMNIFDDYEKIANVEDETRVLELWKKANE